MRSCSSRSVIMPPWICPVVMSARPGLSVSSCPRRLDLLSADVPLMFLLMSAFLTTSILVLSTKSSQSLKLYQCPPFHQLYSFTASDIQTPHAGPHHRSRPAQGYNSSTPGKLGVERIKNLRFCHCVINLEKQPLRRYELIRILRHNRRIYLKCSFHVRPRRMPYIHTYSFPITLILPALLNSLPDPLRIFSPVVLV